NRPGRAAALRTRARRSRRELPRRGRQPLRPVQRGWLQAHLQVPVPGIQQVLPWWQAGGPGNRMTKSMKKFVLVLIASASFASLASAQVVGRFEQTNSNAIPFYYYV